MKSTLIQKLFLGLNLLARILHVLTAIGVLFGGLNFRPFGFGKTCYSIEQKCYSKDIDIRCLSANSRLDMISPPQNAD
jgi:hypothetical protein